MHIYGLEDLLSPYLHGGDVLRHVLDAPAPVPVPVNPGPKEGQQRENPAVVRLIAVDLVGRAGAGRRTVEHRTQVLVDGNAEQEENPPPATHPRRRS